MKKSNALAIVFCLTQAGSAFAEGTISAAFKACLDSDKDGQVPALCLPGSSLGYTALNISVGAPLHTAAIVTTVGIIDIIVNGKDASAVAATQETIAFVTVSAPVTLQHSKVSSENTKAAGVATSEASTKKSESGAEDKKPAALSDQERAELRLSVRMNKQDAETFLMTGEATPSFQEIHSALISAAQREGIANWNPSLTDVAQGIVIF